VQWLLTDHLGSIRDIIDNDGVVLNQINYDAFGKVISESNSSIDSRYLYTGREWDDEIGLYYYRARYYDAEIGRFIAEDPISFNSGDSNLYRYVGNNSLSYIDPTGKLSAELTALVGQSHPGSNKGSKDSSIWFFNTISPTYTKALSTATFWFYIITERDSREQEIPNSKSGIPWLAVGYQLKNNLGKVVLRPWGASRESLAEPAPKLDFQRDENGQWPWEGKMKISEIIFPVEDDSDRHNPPCPELFPEPEPQFIPSESEERHQEMERQQPSLPSLPSIPNPLELILPIIQWIWGGERRA
jgi:RHS repeat-associated protein